MNEHYRDGMIYPPLPKQTEGYHGDYWTDDDLTGYALDFWEANASVSDAMVDRALQAISDFQQANTHIGEDVTAYRRRMQRAALQAAYGQQCVSTRPAESVAQGGEEWQALHGMWRALVDAGGATTVARWGAGNRQDEWATAVVAGMLAIERHFHPERFDSFCTGTPTPATGSGGEA